MIKDKNALADDLTTAFIHYQHNLDSPMDYKTYEELLVKYRTDYVFNAKVKSLVGGVISIVDKHC